MDSELLLKFIEMFISQTTFRHRRIRFYAFFFWTTFVETAVYCRVFPTDETAVTVTRPLKHATTAVFENALYTEHIAAVKS